nr:MAG TPA: Prohead core protein serine protease [Ackermannviridae sp.]
MAKKCLVYETLGNITAMKVKESLDNNEIRLSGVFGVCGIKNGNNRIYSKENYGQMVESLQKTIATEGCLGELEHPNSMNINLNNVSHKIESVQMHEDGTITGTVVLLDTEKGRNAKAIVEAGVPLYISSRALGSIDESGNVTLTMLKTYDLVGTPGFSQASLHLDENQKFESLNESMCAVILEGEDDKNDDPDKNKDKDKDKTNMKDLKEAVDKLSEKVESLEAELHVAKESINEKDEQIQALTEQVSEFKPTNYDAIESWIKEEFKPEFSQEMANGVQKWVSEEFAPVVQNWVCEQFAPEVQKWVVEQYSPEVQKWVTEHYSPEVQKWIVEQYSPEVQKWIVKQYSPEVQKWIVENYSDELQNWITGQFGKELSNKINENVSEYLESKSNDKFDNIDRMLEMLESGQGSKENEIQILKEQQEKNLGKYATCYAIVNMPNEYRPMFEGLSEQKKDEIALQSRAYDFTKTGVMESFWAGIDFNEKPVQNINENHNQNPVDSYMSSIAAQMMALR